MLVFILERKSSLSDTGYTTKYSIKPIVNVDHLNNDIKEIINSKGIYEYYKVENITYDYITMVAIKRLSKSNDHNMMMISNVLMRQCRKQSINYLIND